MARKNDWKKREGIVYSTSDDFQYSLRSDSQADTLAPEAQRLRITLDKSGRAGKQVTLISGFVGTEDDLKELARRIKAKCGVGGSVKEGNILIQGDFRSKILAFLTENGYKART